MDFHRDIPDVIKYDIESVKDDSIIFSESGLVITMRIRSLKSVSEVANVSNSSVQLLSNDDLSLFVACWRGASSMASVPWETEALVASRHLGPG